LAVIWRFKYFYDMRAKKLDENRIPKVSIAAISIAGRRAYC